MQAHLVMIDGIDGVGKSIVQEAILDYLISQGKTRLDLHDYWRESGSLPQLRDPLAPRYLEVNAQQVLVSSEPTGAYVGRALREEIITTYGSGYSARFTAEMYAIDRLLLYQRVLLPAWARGAWVVQNRGVCTSLVYQRVQSRFEGAALSLAEIIALPGNALALEHAPGLLIIPGLTDPTVAQVRLAERCKQDWAKFEELSFQQAVHQEYAAPEWQTYFRDRGTIIATIDAGISVESTAAQARQMIADYYTTKNVAA